MSAHSEHTLCGINPSLIMIAKVLQPRQNPAAASRKAAAARIPSATHVPACHPGTNQKMAAMLDRPAPIAWANRFGGPATGFGFAKSGATSLDASALAGLSFGPVKARAQKP